MLSIWYLNLVFLLLNSKRYSKCLLAFQNTLTYEQQFSSFSNNQERMTEHLVLQKTPLERLWMGSLWWNWNRYQTFAKYIILKIKATYMLWYNCLINCFIEDWHCVKSIQMQSFFWSVFSRIQSKYEKMRMRKNSVFGHFSRSVNFTRYWTAKTQAATKFW